MKFLPEPMRQKLINKQVFKVPNAAAEVLKTLTETGEYIAPGPELEHASAITRACVLLQILGVQHYYDVGNSRKPGFIELENKTFFSDSIKMAEERKKDIATVAKKVMSASAKELTESERLAACISPDMIFAREIKYPPSFGPANAEAGMMLHHREAFIKLVRRSGNKDIPGHLFWQVFEIVVDSMKQSFFYQKI